MDKDQLLATVQMICEEKNIPFEQVQETIEAALAAAYRKDFGFKGQNVKVNFDFETGESEVYESKTVVEDLTPEELEELERRLNGEFKEETSEESSNSDKSKSEEAKDQDQDGEDDGEEKRRFNPNTEIQIGEARKIDKKLGLGDELKTPLEVPADYGRMAAQTAKQVIIQKLREAERNVILEEYKDKEGELLYGFVQRRDYNHALIDFGNITAILPRDKQIPGERYNTGDRIKVYVEEVAESTKGPQIIVSRTADELLAKLFNVEIPEISSGVVEIKGVAREAGSRSKIFVYTDDESIDPIGSCVGQRGSRIQTIINELNGEKVDIIEWVDDVEQQIANALSPAKIDKIVINEDEKSAVVYVQPDQLSLSIGKAGQNVRLAVKLTGWDLNIKQVGDNGETMELSSSEPVLEDSEDSDVSETPSDEINEEKVVETDETVNQEEVSDENIEADDSSEEDKK